MRTRCITFLGIVTYMRVVGYCNQFGLRAANTNCPRATTHVLHQHHLPRLYLLLFDSYYSGGIGVSGAVLTKLGGVHVNITSCVIVKLHRTHRLLRLTIDP